MLGQENKNLSKCQSFLLHTCCAPCSIAVIDELRQKYRLMVFFYNPNIFPEEEYVKRKKEVVRVCGEWGVPMVDMDYESEKWRQAVRGLETEPEGGRRCFTCFSVRLKKAAQYAAENKFDLFSTTLTSGRTKRADVINPIGEEMGKIFGVSYYAEDWKKNGRQEKGRAMADERKIYRQSYCGCVFSMRSRAAKAPEQTNGLENQANKTG